MQGAKVNSGWIVVGLGFLALAFTFAARSSVSMVIPLWETELGWTRTLSAAGSSLVLAMMAAGSPVAGNLMDRHGPRRVFTFGLVALVAGVGGTAFATQPWHYLILFGIVGGLGWASVSIPLVTAAVSACFDHNRGLAIGIAVSGATGGQLPVLSLLGIAVAVMGWRSSFIGLAVLIALVALLVRFCLPAATNPRLSGESAPDADGLRDRLRFLFGQRTFLLLLAAFTLCGFTTAGVIDVHFIPYAISCGYSLELSTSAYGVHGLGNLVGVALLSWAADHVNRPRLLASVFFVRALLFAYLFQIGTSPANLYLFAAAFGFLNFSVFPIIANIVATHIGVRIIGLTLGLLFGGHSLGAAIGALLGGWFFDLFAAYDLVWWLSLGLAALAGVFAILIPETRPAKTRPVAAAAT